MSADNEIAPPFFSNPSSTEAQDERRCHCGWYHTSGFFLILQFLYRLAKGLICEVVFDDSGNLESMPDQFTRSNWSATDCFPKLLEPELGVSVQLSSNFRSCFQSIVAFGIRDGVIWLLTCQRLMSLHFPTPSSCDALNVIGMQGREKKPKYNRRTKCCQATPSSPNLLMFLI